MNKIHFDSIDSTNNYLIQNYKKLDDYTFVSANFQTCGKGRNKRTWKSENGENLLFSLLLLDKQLLDHYKELSIIAAYSIIKELEKLGINNLKIKWPNDIYVNDKKICGILLESIYTDKMECLIIGVGLNVNQKIFNDEYRVEPTSIINEINSKQDINSLKDIIFNAVVKDIEEVKNRKNFFHLIEGYDYLKGKTISFEENNIEKIVQVKGIQEDYSLLVNDNGKLIYLYSGEVNSINIK